MGSTPPADADSKRKRILRVGAVVVVVVLLLGVPAWLAGRGQFFERFPELSAQYTPWKTSAHAGVGCQGCHVAPRLLDRAAYRASMVPEFYLSLVLGSRKPNTFERPTNEACLECHNDLRSVSPKGDMQIPHRAHVNVLKMECVQCHDFLVHELSPEGKHTPQMEGCMACHDGDTAKDACSACHTEKAVPETHTADDWLIQHAEAATDPECDSCHEWTEDWCVDCHAHRPASHADDWRKVHGDRIVERRNCEACHEGEFCVPCHGEVPQDNLDPTLKLVE